MIRLGWRRAPDSDLVETLHAVCDRLRAGQSLRQSLVVAAGNDGSPLHPVAAALASGRPLATALRDAASDASPHASGSADLASALCVLAVHAEAGGDPLPAVRALAGRLARRRAARDEARALSTQARLGARVVLLLTPLFGVLIAASDARGVFGWLTEPRTRTAVVAGLVLQGLGAMWIAAIVGGVGGDQSRMDRVPLLRAVRAVLLGRRRPHDDAEVADIAETTALVLDAGLSVSASMVAVAPFAHGSFGEVVRAASVDVRAPPHVTLLREADERHWPAAQRFGEAVRSSGLLGVPLAPALRMLADDLRDRSSAHLTEDVRRASVRMLVPLGVVVLPAFVLACLVPLFVTGMRSVTG